MDDAAREHYDLGLEQGRLGSGAGSLELVRTRELLDRFLPKPPAVVLDVGGGPGLYARMLADLGYQVTLIDLMPLHVEQASRRSEACPEAPFTARLGDARDLDEDDESCDAVLLLGPLYHLIQREQRLQALAEAHRVLRPGGLVVGAGISRFASLLDGLATGDAADPRFASIIRHDLRDGQHRNTAPDEHPDWFTTAFFHHPDELAAEVAEAGFTCEALLGVEGPGWLFAERWEDSEVLLEAARAVEAEPALCGLSAHLLVVGRKAQSA